MNIKKIISLAILYSLALSACRKEDNNIVKPLPQHDKLALEYVAEYDISAGGQLVSSSSGKGYFTYEEAVKRFTSFKQGEEEFHLPSLAELRGIIPDKGLVSFTERGSKNGIEEEIMLAGELKSYHADYLNTGEGVTYALRFMGNGDRQLSAWRYRLVNVGKDEAAMEISCRYIGGSAKKNINNVASESFWESDNEGDVVRIFSLNGYKKKTDVLGGGSVYHLWARDERNAYKAWKASVTPVGAFTMFDDKSEALSVRLFQGKAPSVNVKMAIKYVAEYDLDVDGRAFATSHENDKSGGYFSFYEAKNRFKAWREKGGEDTYHVPTVEELRGIFPDKKAIYFNKDTTSLDVLEDIEVRKEKYTYKADYRNPGKGISYALRFKGNGNVQLSAWRYKVCGTFKAKSKDAHIEITCRYLGPENAKLSLEEISKEEYWAANNSNDEVRIFSASGFRPNYNEPVLYSGADCRVWTNSLTSDSKLAWYAFMYEKKVYLGGVIKEAQLPVRLFSDN